MGTDAITDEDLMLRIGEGDQTAYGMLVDRHLSLNLGYATKLLGNSAEGEEVMQEAFIRVWKHAAKWDPARKTKFTTWFYRVVTNLCYDVCRKRKPQENVEILENIPSSDTGAENIIAVDQRSAQIKKVLELLPQRQSTAIMLCYFQGLSNKEAAEVMEVSLNALESYLVRGRRKLAEILGAERDQLLKEIG
ncbi:sigma-70 family RNA polymerase sigma factor [Emcibacteraceae bacterium]|nr:sigma-70 family RNA polymerase sigma factor [Emcibacteraceae bacterium]MDA9554544.1 sigma-70 family RNA polymerase sigma factor [Emcibacteraceae bacterium]MDA9770104.1 sigma-70 family RNA polymerase sigma factor [Emcibacteraceae bacterium]MDC1090142.1 sigma-70 family RNA polymerase sigma factor [Emcibacteraceae bacterium]